MFQFSYCLTGKYLALSHFNIFTSLKSEPAGYSTQLMSSFMKSVVEEVYSAYSRTPRGCVRPLYMHNVLTYLNMRTRADMLQFIFANHSICRI